MKIDNFLLYKIKFLALDLYKIENDDSVEHLKEIVRSIIEVSYKIVSNELDQLIHRTEKNDS